MTVLAAALEELERAVERALVEEDAGHLEVLGYGEISSVLAYETPGGRKACKRLPLFEGLSRFAAYAESFDAYVNALRARGVAVVESELVTVWREDGQLAAYCVQPALSGDMLLPVVMRSMSLEESLPLFDRVLDGIVCAVGPRLGLDGQLSNWVWDGTQLGYLDVTTPMMRTSEGAEMLDKALFLASLPWVIRGVVMRFVLQGILDKYYDPRGVVLDVLGNLFKERVDARVEAYVERANDKLGMGFTMSEVRRYYREDAWTWEVLQRLRRLDSLWQRRVRRRPYPFLLPGRIVR